jgi:hypothetical protein
MQPPMMQRLKKMGNTIDGYRYEVMQCRRLRGSMQIVWSVSECAFVRSLVMRIASLKKRLSLRLALVMRDGNLSSW